MAYELDVCVPVYGGLKHLQRLVPALAATTDEKVHVTFVDDCTPSEKGGRAIRAFLEEETYNHPNWELKALEKNGGFANANHEGLDYGNAPYVLSLNSDTVPHPNWWQSLVRTLKTVSNAGGAGSKLIYPLDSMDPERPAGLIQHAGVVFNSNRMPYHIFHKWHPEKPKVNRHLMMKACTGACLAFKRPIWRKSGGFDPRYGVGRFEDIALCLTVVDLGYEIAYDPDSLLEHFNTGSGNMQDSDRNSLQFAHDWADKIVCDDWMYW